MRHWSSHCKEGQRQYLRSVTADVTMFSTAGVGMGKWLSSTTQVMPNTVDTIWPVLLWCPRGGKRLQGMVIHTDTHFVTVFGEIISETAASHSYKQSLVKNNPQYLTFYISDLWNMQTYHFRFQNVLELLRPPWPMRFGDCMYIINATDKRIRRIKFQSIT